MKRETVAAPSTRAAWNRCLSCCDESVVDAVAGSVDISAACADPLAVEFVCEETRVGLVVVEGAGGLAAASGDGTFVPE